MSTISRLATKRSIIKHLQTFLLSDKLVYSFCIDTCRYTLIRPETELEELELFRRFKLTKTDYNINIKLLR